MKIELFQIMKNKKDKQRHLYWFNKSKVIIINCREKIISSKDWDWNWNFAMYWKLKSRFLSVNNPRPEYFETVQSDHC